MPRTIPVAILTLAAGLRLWDLTGRDLWIDLRDRAALARDAEAIEDEIKRAGGPAARYFTVIVGRHVEASAAPEGLGSGDTPPTKVLPVNVPLALRLLDSQRSIILERLGEFVQSVVTRPIVVDLSQFKPPAPDTQP